MAYNEKLADRIREAIADKGNVEEKKMFSSMCFMLNDKMCICVGHDDMLCRIGADAKETALQKTGCTDAVMQGRVMKDYVYVSPDGFRLKKDFDYWVKASLAFNKEAKAAKPKKKK